MFLIFQLKKLHSIILETQLMPYKELQENLGQGVDKDSERSILK